MSVARIPVVLLVVASIAGSPAAAGANRVEFEHGVLKQRLTTRMPDSPTGANFMASYHAADDPDRDPPLMDGMTSYPARGFRYDTDVPAQCTASDQELALLGAEACPPESRIGGGSVRSKFMGFENETSVETFNNAGEQIMIVRSPFVATIARGRIKPDQSVEWRSPRCYPALSSGDCPVDNVLQLGSSIKFEPYVRDGRSYMTTPPRCPRSRRWRSRIRFWWADGSTYTVPVRVRCRRPNQSPSPG